MIEELAVKLRAEKKEPPKQGIYIVLWQGQNQLGNGDKEKDNQRDNGGDSGGDNQSDNSKSLMDKG